MKLLCFFVSFFLFSMLVYSANFTTTPASLNIFGILYLSAEGAFSDGLYFFTFANDNTALSAYSKDLNNNYNILNSSNDRLIATSTKGDIPWDITVSITGFVNDNDTIITDDDLIYTFDDQVSDSSFVFSFVQEDQFGVSQYVVGEYLGNGCQAQDSDFMFLTPNVLSSVDGSVGVDYKLAEWSEFLEADGCAKMVYYFIPPIDIYVGSNGIAAGDYKSILTFLISAS